MARPAGALVCALLHLPFGDVAATDAEKCGIKGPDSTAWKHSRIVNGQAATACEWKWLACLLFKDPDTGQISPNCACGGTLISESWVLTAAHCLDSSDGTALALTDVKVVLGDWNYSIHEGNEVERTPKRLIQHPSWDPSAWENDIALIEVDAVALDDCIGVACMPTVDVDLGTGCFIVGWGSLYDHTPGQGSGPQPAVKHEARVLTVANAQCTVGNASSSQACPDYEYNVNYAGNNASTHSGVNSAASCALGCSAVGEPFFVFTKYGDCYCKSDRGVAMAVDPQSGTVSGHSCVPQAKPGQGITDDMLCAIGEGDPNGPHGGRIDSCAGDSGGPLVCESDGAYTVYGAVSYGWECAQPGNHGVYARVHHFMQWIARTTGSFDVSTTAANNPDWMDKKSINGSPAAMSFAFWARFFVLFLSSFQL